MKNKNDNKVVGTNHKSSEAQKVTEDTPAASKDIKDKQADSFNQADGSRDKQASRHNESATVKVANNVKSAGQGEAREFGEDAVTNVNENEKRDRDVSDDSESIRPESKRKL